MIVCHKKTLSLNLKKLQIEEYYHKRRTICDMKSVSDMAHTSG